MSSCGGLLEWMATKAGFNVPSKTRIIVNASVVSNYVLDHPSEEHKVGKMKNKVDPNTVEGQPAVHIDEQELESESTSELVPREVETGAPITSPPVMTSIPEDTHVTPVDETIDVEKEEVGGRLSTVPLLILGPGDSLIPPFVL
ncbi:hypothetical protein RHSIM_Rhsim01G0162000 [Rhododendron simsii]|uniref:Uncharacterized protein n=1 Tax=Rhododendron simsii TaxID=118357 RepID=A0A834LZI6_RHOSS|nr:hypothetical protein RHSIM_Rhsim01G0162000 [Rhododendron simsii]